MSDDIKTKDLRNILKDLVKDDKNDDLALKVFYLILFMKVVIPDTSTQVSTRDYQGSIVTGCGIALLLMYLDFLIHGKKSVVDLGTRRVNFKDQAKLRELASADLWKTHAEVVLFVHTERPVLTMPRVSGLASEGVPKVESSEDVHNGAPHEVRGGSSAHMNASAGISSHSAKGFFDATTVSLGWIDGLLSTICGEIVHVPTKVEHLSRVYGILPPGRGFDAESLKEALSTQAEYFSQIRESLVHLCNNLGMFKQLQDARCKPFEDEASVVISQMERPDFVDLGHGRENEDRVGEC
ncbi:hypothetical protein ZWY2020_003874 [Hordeum vulgare]|nr:hypothetical protein ZWY2020_003874 [Hordeum vulgare]